MKKIFTLLALLMTTVASMALDFTDTYKCHESGQSSNPYVKENAKLTVVDNGDGTYNVTFHDVYGKFNSTTDNFGTMTFSNIAGTTTDGITEVQTTSAISGTVTNISASGPTQANVYVKFKEDGSKAYATLNAQTYVYNAVIYYTFGTDEGWTDGGNTGSGDDKPAVSGTKLVEDGFAPNGAAIPAKAFTVNWDAQKFVANLDLSSCTGENEDIISISNNETNLAIWNPSDGFSLHFYYTKSGSLYTANGWLTADKTFCIQYNGNTVTKYYNVADAANCVVEVSKEEGVKVDGNVLITPSEIEALFAESNLVFGSTQGDNRSNALYKSVEIVNLNGGGETPVDPTVEWTSEFTDNAMTQYLANDESDVEVQYIKNAKVKLEKYTNDTYTATLYGVVAGADGASLGDITLAGLVEADGAYTLASAANVTVAAPGSAFDGKTYSVQSLAIQPNDSKLFVQMIMGNPEDYSMVAYQFGEVFIPATQTFTNEAHVTLGDATTNYTDAQVELTEFMEGVYRVTYKNLTVGEQTGDFVIDNLEPTVDADNNVTFATSETEAEWGNTYKAFSDLAITAVKGEEGFENLVVKFTTEGANVVFGEGLPTPPAEVEESKTYTDKLSYTASTTPGANEEQELTVEKMTDGTYNLKFANVNSYNTLYMELGEITFTGVEGTTDENGLTTIEATAPAVTLGENGFLSDTKEGTLVAKFNGEKAYLHYTGNLKATYSGTFPYELTYGIDEFTAPVDDYAINFDKDGQNHHASRRTTSVSLQQEGKDVQTLTFDDSTNGYEDHSEDMTFSVEAGSEVATTFGYNGEWMHGYVYIDLDDNKQFDVNADDLDNSPELVAYSYYNDLNSDGEAVSANVNVTPPTFTAPATPGTYRIRFKIDWNSVDPGGCADSGNHILNNGGGIWDATLEVTEPIVDAINSINAEAAQGNAEIFTVNGTKVAKLQKGINLVRTADGKVKKVLVK